MWTALGGVGPIHPNIDQMTLQTAPPAAPAAAPIPAAPPMAPRPPPRARHGAHARALGDLGAAALVRCRTCLVRQPAARRDVLVGSGLSDLLVLLVAVQNRPRGGATDDPNHEKSQEPELHSTS